MIIDFSFEPGVAYWFKSVMRDGERFLAVAADREGKEVSFVKSIVLHSHNQNQPSRTVR
jgi:hypothetical protein